MRRDKYDRPVCTGTGPAMPCLSPVDPHYAICTTCKAPYTREQIEAAKEWQQQRLDKASQLIRGINNSGYVSMSCPHCDHTMQNLGSPGRTIWWCSHCGTLKERTGDLETVTLPGQFRLAVAAAELDPGQVGTQQSVHLEASVHVWQSDREPPSVVLNLRDRRGKDVF